MTTPSAPSKDASRHFLDAQPPLLFQEGNTFRGTQARLKGVLWMLLAVLAFAPTAVLAQQAEQPKKEAAQPKPEETQKPTEELKTEEDSKLTTVPGGKALGMSILGNQEAPKALVIVPWKSSEPGNGPNVTTLLDDSRLPIDKEVFMRMLSYYEIKSGTAPANAAQRRNP